MKSYINMVGSLFAGKILIKGSISGVYQLNKMTDLKYIIVSMGYGIESELAWYGTPHNHTYILLLDESTQKIEFFDSKNSNIFPTVRDDMYKDLFHMKFGNSYIDDSIQDVLEFAILNAYELDADKPFQISYDLKKNQIDIIIK